VYYGTSPNPFENVIASVSGSFKIAKDTYLKVQPYWYGCGLVRSGVERKTGLLGGAKDLNGDGDTLDTVRVARSKAHAAPGRDLGNQHHHRQPIPEGRCLVRAQHRQTQPAVQLNADGPSGAQVHPARRWQLLRRP
jgi:iron complex outermembrane receptor protein